MVARHPPLLPPRGAAARRPGAASRGRRAGGFSLVELMIALALGLLLTAAAGSVYVSGRTAFGHQQQLSALQHNIRMAFEFLAADARMAGYMGCFAGQGASPDPDFPAGGDLASNHAVGVEGYDYRNASADAFTIAALAPANESSATRWDASGDARATALAVTGAVSIAGSAAGDGLTPGSDVLVIRTVAGKGARVTAATPAGNEVAIESLPGGGRCSDGVTPRVSGLCPGSHALLASCSAARRFAVTAIAGTTLTVPGRAFLADEYTPPSAEVYPLQTVVYYVKRSTSGSSTSLYRRTFDGTVAGGTEHELIDGVDNMQLRYGRDTTTPAPDGIVDDYVSAREVSDWSRVVTVRMSLLLRSAEPLAGVSTAASAVVNGVTVAFPDTRHDRRVFTTTVAVRNRTSYF